MKQQCTFSNFIPEKTRIYEASFVSTRHLGCHSWHSCNALKETKATTTMSSQAASLQI